jgi:hypothetical protein
MSFGVKGKIVVFVVNKDGLFDAQQTLPNGVPSADPSLPDLETPLYVLVNSNTASAAEVLSAALKVLKVFQSIDCTDIHNILYCGTLYILYTARAGIRAFLVYY